MSPIDQIKQKYRYLFESMSQGIFYQKADGSLIDVNSKTLELFGIDRDQFFGRTSLDPAWKVIREDGSDYPGEDHPSMVALKTGKPVENAIAGVFNPHKKDYVWLSITAIPMFHENETKPYQVFVTMHDITELRKARNDYEMLFKEMTSGFALHEIILNKKGRPCDYRFLSVNPAFEALTALKAKDLIGKTVLEVLPGTEDFWIQTYGKVALTAEPISFEHFSEELGRYYEVRAFSPTKGQFACLFHDVTQQRQFQDDLIRHNQLLDESQKLAGSGGWGIDLETMESYWTKHQYNLFGYDPEEINDLHTFFLNRIVFPQDLAIVRNNLKTALDIGKGVQFEYRIVKKDGTVRHLSSKALPVMDKEGHVKRIFGVNLDITDKVNTQKEKQVLEAQLRQAHKLEAIGTLSGGIAHEFNNILGIILGNIELAQDDIPQWNPASFFLKEIKSASLRGRDIVRQLLSFSRKSEEQRKNVNLYQAVTDSLKFLRSSISSNIEFETSLQKDVFHVWADQTQIHQVLINIINNAAQELEKTGGTISILLQNIRITPGHHLIYPELVPGDYVRLAISDTGSGIDPDIIDRIFDPFFTTKDATQGTGMGLAVVHGIINNHKGIIKAISRKNKGATFDILLPKSTQSSQPVKKEGVMPAKGSGRVLLVDDEIQICQMFSKLLNRMGYEVHTSTDPLEAFKEFENNSSSFDCVVTDMTMPGMMGDELAARIYAIRPDIPVILCTGYSDKANDHTLLDKGITKILMKPFTGKDLAHTIEEVIENN